MPEGNGATAAGGNDEPVAGSKQTGGGAGSGSTPAEGGGGSGSDPGSAGEAPQAGAPPDTCLGEEDCPWSLGGVMPMHARGQAAVSYQGAIYLFGGTSPELDVQERPPEEPDPDNYKTVLRYDPMTRESTPLAPMVAGLYMLNAHVLGDKIYIFGGYGTGGFNDLVQIYDPAEDSWATGPSMPTKRYIFSSEVVGGKVFVIGGQGPVEGSESWSTFDVVEVFDPESGWSTATPAPRALAGYASCALDGRIYTFGGEAGNRTQIYDVATDTWTEASPPSQKRNGHSCVRVDDALVVLGGRNNSVLRLVERYHPEDDSWERLPPLTTTRLWFASAALEQNVYVFGGEDSVGERLDSIEILDVSKL